MSILPKAFLICILSILPTLCQAHSWYDLSCCGGSDCHPIASCSDLKDDGKGGYTYGRYHFDPSDVKASHDNQCHVCITNEKEPNGVPHCVYIPFSF